MDLWSRYINFSVEIKFKFIVEVCGGVMKYVRIVDASDEFIRRFLVWRDDVISMCWIVGVDVIDGVIYRVYEFYWVLYVIVFVLECWCCW